VVASSQIYPHIFWDGKGSEFFGNCKKYCVDEAFGAGFGRGWAMFGHGELVAKCLNNSKLYNNPRSIFERGLYNKCLIISVLTTSEFPA